MVVRAFRTSPSASCCARRILTGSPRTSRGGGTSGRGRPSGRRNRSSPFGLSIELVVLLVNGAVVAATEQGEIRERGGAPLGPVTDVMSLSEPDPAAREPAAAVAVMERPPEGRRDGPGAGADLDDLTIRGVPHHHAARIARQAPGGFRGNVRPVLEDGLAGRVRVRQRRDIYMDDHLVSLSRDRKSVV